MRIAILGSQGQLGGELCRQLGDEAVPLSRPACDITNYSAVREDLVRLSPDAVINAAAYTKVDLAETNPRECFLINAEAVANLAAVCAGLDVPLVQISTDYVFCGNFMRTTAFTEDEPPCPNGIYARSKLAGEQAAATCPKHLIVRTCGLYGRRSKSTQANFVDTMLRLGCERGAVRVVADQRCTPSNVSDVADGIRMLIALRAGGIYHVVNEGETTWHEFATEVFRAAQFEVRVEAISTSEYGAVAPRPAYSVLSMAKFNSLTGRKLPEWRVVLHDYVIRALQAANAA